MNGIQKYLLYLVVGISEEKTLICIYFKQSPKSVICNVSAQNALGLGAIKYKS